jgi:hypothetical protein
MSVLLRLHYSQNANQNGTQHEAEQCYGYAVSYVIISSLRQG